MAFSFTVLTDLPTPPQRSDPDNFASRADTFVSALDGFQVEMNTTIAELNQITSGLDQTSPIIAWSAVTTYNFPDAVAGSDGHTYRCIDTLVLNVNPTTDDGTYWLDLSSNTSGIAPLGSIIAWIGGYFTSGANNSFTNVLGDDAATINAIINNDGWYVCDGANLNLSASSIFNGAGRYLPNLTGSRFLMGYASAGATGGSSTMSHTHTLSHTHYTDIGSFSSGNASLSTAQLASHRHGGDFANVQTGSGAGVANDGAGTDWYTGYSGSGSAHNHSVNPPGTTSGGASSSTTSGASRTENRPNFLSCFYIMRVV